MRNGRVEKRCVVLALALLACSEREDPTFQHVSVTKSADEIAAWFGRHRIGVAPPTSADVTHRSWSAGRYEARPSGGTESDRGDLIRGTLRVSATWSDATFDGDGTSLTEKSVAFVGVRVPTVESGRVTADVQIGLDETGRSLVVQQVESGVHGTEYSSIDLSAVESEIRCLVDTWLEELESEIPPPPGDHDLVGSELVVTPEGVTYAQLFEPAPRR